MHRYLMDTSNGRQLRYLYFESYICLTHIYIYLDKIHIHMHQPPTRQTTTTTCRNEKNVSTSYLFCFSTVGGPRAEQERESERGEARQRVLGESGRYYGVTRTRISSQFTSSSSTFLLFLFFLLLLLFLGYLYLCMYVCGAILTYLKTC